MRIHIARPRLDCSFKRGPVPEGEEKVEHPIRLRWQLFLDRLETYHRQRGDDVTVDRRPLWQFELAPLRDAALQADAIYVPHRQKIDFDVGPNALYYKASAFSQYFTVDPCGWGASLSWCPVAPVRDGQACTAYDKLVQAARSNVSKFPQPPLTIELGVRDYDLFVCQVPGDETLHYHSAVGVEEALTAVIAHAQRQGRRLVVKGHPANPKAMAGLRALSDASAVAIWIDDVSIQTCLAGAGRVYLVNSGVGFEAILHGKPVTAFGRAEYSAVVASATLEPASIRAADAHVHQPEDYVGMIGAYVRQCVDIESETGFAVLDGIVERAALRRAAADPQIENG